MKFLYDYFPILLFFVAYKTYDIFVATAVAVVASVAQVGYSWLRHRRVEKMHLVSMVLIVLLGGLTIVLRDKSFIMWKPTLVNWAFALVFVLSPLVGGRTLIERMLSSKLSLPRPVWFRLNTMWVAFFVLAGAANIYFAHDYKLSEQQLVQSLPNLDATELETLECGKAVFEPQRELCEQTLAREELWVNFKLFGLLGLTILFIIGQALYLARHIDNDEEQSSPEET